MDVRVKSQFRSLWLVMLIVLLTGFLWGMMPIVARAEDNSSTVPGNPTYTEDAFYYSDQYMWKVSLFVAKSDTVNKESSNMNDFYRIGNQAVYLTPVSNWSGWAAGSRPSNISGLFFSKENKVDTLMELQSKGGDVNALDPVQLASGSGIYLLKPPSLPPYVPQLNDGDINDNGVIHGDAVGSITKVANYFNSLDTINTVLNFYAGKQGVSKEDLVKGLEFTIDGETRTGWNPKGILPDAINDNPTNQVEWLVVYEPVSIVYVKDTAHKGSYYGYALSATDFAVSQIKHQMDWRYDETRWTAWAGQQPDAWKANANRQHVSRLAFLLMGNSVITSSNWYGLEAGPGVDQNAAIPFNRWFSDKQTKYGGWGMTRWIKPAEYNKPRDNDYRPNTDVVLSTPVYSNINATPGSELTVTYKINGEVIGTDSLVAPMKTESYSYIKWHTPDVNTVTSYDLEMSISPYPEGTINCGGNEYTHRTLTIRPLEESVPPDPKVEDKIPTDLPTNLVPPSSVPGEDTADETVAPVVKSVKAVTEAPYYKNETVKIEVVTNRATKNLTFTNTDSGVGKQFGSDSLGDGMLISRSVNELANEIVWTIEFVPANLGTNHYAFKSLNAAAGESEVFAYDVEVVVDPDIPVIYDVLINPVQALYTLYEEVIKTPLTYEVYFNTNGGNEMGAQSAEYNTLLTEPGQPTREGYSFKGWNKDSSFVYPWNFESDRIMGVTTLYAKWEINTYLVHFDPQGGSNTFSPVTVEYGANIEEPAPIPTRSNYAFLGWYKDIGCNTPWNFTEDTITGDTTLYGKWDATALTVTFDSQGGSEISTQQVDYDAFVVKPDDSQKVGFTFKGWYQDAACNTVWTFASDRVKTNLTLFAKWDVNLYTVSFDSLGGSAVSDQIAQNDTITSKPVDPIRIGFSFKGWFKEDACITPWDFGADKVTQNTTLYALWTADEAAIEFVTNNGTDVPKMVGATDREILDTNMPITVRDGYTFSGWFASADFSGDVVTALPGKYPIGTTVYYAKWTANPAFIEFVTNGGSTVSNMTGVTDQAIVSTAFPTTSRAGYTFSGWYQEADVSGTEVTTLPGKYPIGTTTYYAKWTPDPAYIEFNVNGGSDVTTMTGVTDQAISPVTMPTTSRAGYTFSGWFAEADFSGSEVTALPGKYPIGTTTYYAKWTANPAAIEFIANGGSTVTNMTGVTDQTISPTTMPTTSKTGYTFENWYENADFSGDPVTVLPSAFPAGTKTYYAKWTPIKYAVSFDSQSGSAVDIQMVDYDTLAILPATPTRSGYTFTGWFQESGCTTPWNFSSDKITKDVTLYAGWKLGIPDASVPLEYWSWEQINQVAELGLGESYFDIGEEKNIKLSTGEILTLQIYGFNHDQLANGTSNKTNITFGLKNLMAEKRSMNPTSTTSGGWDGSDMRSWSNGTLHNSLPSDLKSCVKSVLKPTSKGTTVISNSIDKIFLFSSIEITGSTLFSEAGEGTKYPIFTDDTSRIKKLSNGQGVSDNWSLRSINKKYSSYFCLILNDGRAFDAGAYAPFGVNFGFAIGNSPTNTYPIIYNSNGGSAVSNGTGTLNQLIAAPTAPTKSNMTFGGWFRDAGLTQKWDFATDKITGATTLYAKWQATITFNSLGGTAVAPLVTDTYASFSAPPSPSKDGWVFKGWYKESGCLSAWNFAVDKPTVNTTLYAKWEVGLPDSSVPLNNWSWDQINQVAELGLAESYFDIGEEKNIVVNGEILTLEIYDFNHDILEGGTGNKTNITFGLKNLMSMTKKMNSTGINVGGWDASEMRSWTNGELYLLMPTDIRSAIKTVQKYTSGGYGNENIVTSADNIFLFSEVEYFGRQTYSIAGEGKQYPIFTTNASRIKKHTSGAGYGDDYWGRSAYTIAYHYFNSVGNVGSTEVMIPFAESYVNFGFCIGNAPTNTYSVTYESNGGSAVSATTATLNTTIAEPTAPVKANATFDGWYKDVNLTSKFNFATEKVVGSTKLYAKWSDLPLMGTPLVDCTWKQIALVADLGLGANYWSVGDTKSLTLNTGETVVMQILGFNHDTLSSENVKSNITFGVLDPGTLKHSMNSTNTNAGGWGSSGMRMYLNGAFLNSLPSDVKTNIRVVKKEYSPKTESWFGAWYATGASVSSDMVFLLSDKEVTGVIDYNKFDEGTQYSIFTKSGTSRSGSEYWLRTQVDNRGGLRANPQNTNNGFYCITGTLLRSSYEESQTYANRENSVVFAFCMGTNPNYAVNFDSQGGSAVTSKTAVVNTTTTAPATPTKSGKTFAGWFKDATGTEEWNFLTDKVTGPTTLYAKWITLPAIGTSLESCSWDQIAYISKAGLADTYFDVGNEKNITLSTGEVLTMQIYDFAHDSKADGSGKAGITFGSKYLMSETKKMNSSDTNTGGWNASELRSWTNGALYDSMPKDIQTYMKLVNKQTSGGYSTSSVIESKDKIFLFSEIELFGSRIYSVAGEGYQYPVFTGDASRIKRLSNGIGVDYDYWGRSSCSSYGDFTVVSNNGSGNTNPTPKATNKHGIAFGFCV